MMYKRLTVWLIGSIAGMTFLLSCVTKRPIHSKYLHGGSRKYWSSQIGYDWMFQTDGTFVEYLEDSNGRHIADYGDFRVFIMTYDLSGNDSLIIYSGPRILSVYRIERLSQNELVVTSTEAGWGVDTLRFYSSIDQRTNPLPSEP